MQTSKIITTCLLIVAVGAPLAAGKTIETRGTLDAVTVYRGRALVTRLVEVPGPAGLHEVVVTDLPEHVVPGSIYAESADGVSVRSVRYRVRPVPKDVRKEVREIDAGIREVRQEIETNARNQKLIQEHAAYLNKLDQFTAPTANVELTKGVLDMDTLRKLTLFLFEQRESLAQRELQLGRERREFDDELELLQRKRNVLTGGSARTVREAVVFVELPSEKGARLRLNYLVEKANWSPSYNVRTDADRGRVLVEYNASIQQRSGEDWNDVAMTLSTATPSLIAKAPELLPLTVALSSQVAGQSGNRKGDYARARKELRDKRAKVQSERNFANQRVEQSQKGRRQQPFDLWDAKERQQADWTLNTVARDLQVLDLVTRARLTRATPAARGKNEGVSVTYRLEGRTTLPSRSDRQLVQIASMPMNGSFYEIASPVLTDFVYEEATVINDSDRVLLAGPASAFADGQFVGHCGIPTVAVGESFSIGFGIDSSLRASRELVNKREKIQGGNRVVTFNYRLAIENFGTTPSVVRLMDRLPRTKAGELTVTLESNGAGLSTDPVYQKTRRTKGILRWDIEVPPQSIGPDAVIVEYTFRLEYDKEMSINALAMARR